MALSDSAQNSKTKTAPPELEKGIPNIPDKSLLALKVEYASGQLPSRIPMQGLPSTTAT
ncbi:hypothetical protein [Microvirga yunnanensis]|uniref:hypothetical protein n=1 Tax=Microvirga yunnanensis TaxID=2953740 RepID=UPI0021C6FCFA|nr:hypothetical protein [Microvirga sp. HBU65207]